MAYDKTKPANSDLISDSAADLRANFSAIETGDSSLLQDAINLQEQGSNPSAITGSTAAAKAFRLYAKTDSDSGQTEFFGIDDGGNVLQFSEGGYLGARDMQAILQDITIGSNSFVNNQNNFVWAYGRVPAGGGAVTGGQGLGTATESSGTYTIPFSGKTPSNTNYTVMAVGTTGTTHNRTANVVYGSQTTGQFQVRIQRIGASSSSFDSTTDFYVMVAGGF